MDVEKLRNLTDAELVHQQHELNDQLFRMKFQLKMGQTESLNKIRGLRKDVARIKTVIREKELGLVHESKPAPAVEGADAVTKPKPKPAKKSAAARKTAARSKATASAKTARNKKKTRSSGQAKARKQ
jgi:large subunit ribosomal protein L29